ncbi:MAG: amino acid adenylation domain-containing protein [Acidobacteriota bacterium]|nr:amino acid adenylation domain-containing protein [Acidobacteriota bacterium]
MVDQQARVAALSPAKLRLLARRLDQRRQKTELPRIVPSAEDRHQPFALTEVQEAYWLGRQRLFDLGGVAAHGYNEIEVPELDLECFEGALRRVIARHDMLRMVVRSDGRQQILREVPDYRLRSYDLRSRSDEEAQAQRLELRAEMSHQVLDASTWPLFDIRACRLPDGRVRLHISFDIMVADLTGYQILMRDLGRFYADPSWDPPPLELSFRDYVVTHEELAQSDLFHRSMEYWRQRLPELQSPPELPLARDPSQLDAPRFERRFALLDRDAWSRLKERAAQARLSSSGLLIAAFSEILGRWSKDPRFTLTLTLFNPLPLHPQVFDIVGDFTSLALLSVNCASGETFAARARAVQRQLGRDLEHSQVGGVRVLRELARQRGMATAAMPVVFTSSLVDRGPRDEAAPAGEGILGESVFSISQTPQVWLDHQVYEQNGSLHYNWDAVEQLFPQGLLDDMFEAYGELLNALVHEDRAWNEPLRPGLPEDQRARRQRANETAAPIPRGLLHQPFEGCIEARGDQPAVLTADRELGYRELDRRSAVVAAVLRERGIGRGRQVAVIMDKGWEQVVAVLAILRAGATYLPIDAGLPEERIRHLVERGEVTAALIQSARREALEAILAGSRVPSWAVDEIGESVASAERFKGSWEPSEVLADPADLAYVIFTSGSTGQPKGVMIDHRGALNTLEDLNLRFGVGPRDRVLGLSSLSFDLSVYDLFGLLAVGGAVVLPEAGSERDPTHWAGLMERHGVTVWNTVPALMEMLVEDLESRGVPGPGALRLVLLSGDWLPVTLPERIRALWPEAQVVSLGGATEASIWSILYPVDEVSPQWKSIPYGRAMVNQTFDVLDHRLEPRPEWVPGQLYIGGTGLAQGYWRDPQQTAASFVVHSHTGERLYRTGDLGRWLPGGVIEFLGREDHQVKIQGHRIELGEIEVRLEHHPEVRAAVVDALGQARGPRSLAAWVVPVRREDGEDIDTGALAAGWPEEARRPSLTALGAWIGALEAKDLGGAFRKRSYASAGSLYPVQAYLEVGSQPKNEPDHETAAGLEAGLYYYEPRRHGLVSLESGGGPGRGYTLHLVGDCKAIAPVYPRWADLFLQLEAGYLLEVLDARAQADGLALRQVEPLSSEAVSRLAPAGILEPVPLLSLEIAAAGPPEADGQASGEVPWELGDGASLEPDPELPPRPGGALRDAVEITTFRLSDPGVRRDLEGRPWWPLHREGGDPGRRYRVRRSHRVFLDAPVDGAVLQRCLARTWAARPQRTAARWLLVVRDGRVAGLHGGVYGVGSGGEVERVASSPVAPDLPVAMHAEVNRAAFEDAAVSLFAVAPAEGAALACGRLGQLLMEQAAYLGGLGWCPIGSLEDEAPVRRLLGLDEQEILVHSFVGGAVTVELGDRRSGDRYGTRDGNDSLIGALKQHLAAALPSYMVPETFLLLDRLPLSANGKVDRKALPVPGAAGDAGAAGSEPPSTPWQKYLAELWMEFLGVETVGVHDNFFALGGDSVRAIRILGRLRQVGVELSARQLFDANTLDRLAALLEREVGPEPPAPGAEAEAAAAPRAARPRLVDDEELDDLAQELAGSEDPFGDEDDDDF